MHLYTDIFQIISCVCVDHCYMHLHVYKHVSVCAGLTSDSTCLFLGDTWVAGLQTCQQNPHEVIRCHCCAQDEWILGHQAMLRGTRYNWYLAGEQQAVWYKDWWFVQDKPEQAPKWARAISQQKFWETSFPRLLMLGCHWLSPLREADIGHLQWSIVNSSQ